MENPLAPQVRPKRLEFLDGLRGLAALAVFLAHFGVFFFTWDKASGFDPYRALAAVKDQLLNGAFAVYVFFALSGFVIAQSAASGRRALPSRLLARYLRLTIPMTVSLIWGWCLLVLFAKTRLQMDHSALRDLYRAYFLVQAPSFLEPLKAGFYGAYLHGTSALNPVVWTMRVELLGSCAVYVFYRFCPETWRVRGLCLVVLLNTLAGGHAYLGFSLGALIREAWIGHHLRDNPLSGWR
ncbi:MAG: acyltransferase family protein [Verrucomicrobiota bacterium]